MKIWFNQSEFKEMPGRGIILWVGTEGIENPEFIWNSSDEEVVTVDHRGFALAGNEGRAVITVTLKGHENINAQCDFICKYYPFQDAKLMTKHNRIVVNRIRRKKAVPMPPSVAEVYDNHINTMEAIALREYKETGQWFFVRGTALPKVKDDDDFAATSAVYGALRHKYNFKELPGYSEENHRKMVDFWRSWQNAETGIFINPRIEDPQNPRNLEALKEEHRYSQKGFVGLFRELEIFPFYPYYSMVEREELNLEELWDMVVLRNTFFAASISGKMLELINVRFETGETELKVFIENYMSVLARRFRPDSGLTKADGFHDYGNSENTLKIQGRIILYLGLQNLPYMKNMADTLLKFCEEMKWGGSPGCARNYTDMFITCLFYQDYRREELYQAVKDLTSSMQYIPGDPSIGYRMFNIRLAGTILNWENLAEEAWSHTTNYQWGLPFKHHYFVGPYGRWVNLKKKEPCEIIGHPDFDYEKYGMEARNNDLLKRVIYNKCPNIEADQWYYTDQLDGAVEFHQSTPFEGLKHGKPDFSASKSFLLKQKVSLEGTKGYDMPFLKAMFKGSFDLYLNGTYITSVTAENVEKDWGWCGFFIDKDKREAIKEGENIISVTFTDSQPDSYIRAGFLDWTHPSL